MTKKFKDFIKENKVNEATYKGPIQPGDNVIPLDGGGTIKVAELKGSGFTDAEGVYYELAAFRKKDAVIPGEGPSRVDESVIENVQNKIAAHRAAATEHNGSAIEHATKASNGHRDKDPEKTKFHRALYKHHAALSKAHTDAADALTTIHNRSKELLNMKYPK